MTKSYPQENVSMNVKQLIVSLAFLSSVVLFSFLIDTQNISLAWPQEPPSEILDQFIAQYTSSRSLDVHGINIVQLSYSLLIYLLCCLVGFHFIRGFLLKNSSSHNNNFKNKCSLTDSYFLFFGSFFFGYFFAIGSLRIISVILPAQYSIIASYVLMLGYALSFAQNFNNFKFFAVTKKQLLIHISFCILSLFLVVLFFVVQVQPHPNHYLTGDSTRFSIFFLENIKDFSFGHSFYIPIFGIHYDELFFSLFSITPQGLRVGEFSIFQSFWFVAAVSKFSCFCLLFFVCKIITNSRPYSLLICIFLFFGVFTLNPFHYTSFSDSLTPLVHSLQIGRIIGDIIFPIFSIFLMRSESFNLSKKQIAVLVIAGVGFSSITFASIFVFFSVIVFFITAEKLVQKYRNGSTKFHFIYNKIIKSNSVCTLSKVFIPVSILILFLVISPELSKQTRLLSLVFGVLMVLAAYYNNLALYLKHHATSLEELNTLPIIYFCSGIIIGLIFLGNLPAMALSMVLSEDLNYVKNLMKIVLPAFNEPIEFWGYGHKPIITESVADSDVPNYTDKWSFLKTHGFLFFCIATVLLERTTKTPTLDGQNSHLLLKSFSYISLIGLMCGTYIIMNLSMGVANHLKTRFVEPFIYLSVISCLLFSFRYSSNYQKYILIAYMLFCIFAAQLYSDPFYKQMLMNIKYISDIEFSL